MVISEREGDFMKYYMLFVNDIRFDKPPTEISREEAIRGLSHNYRNPEKTLEESSLKNKVPVDGKHQSPLAFYWKEKGLL